MKIRSYTYFKGGTATPRANVYARMVDYMWGAASYFSVPAMMALGIPIQEGGAGPIGTPPSGNNWCNVDTGAAEFESFMSEYNVTDVAFDGSSSIASCDAINAAAAMYLVRYYYNHITSETGNDLLRDVLNSYTYGPNPPHPVEYGYGYSVLFKAYGNTWSSADGTGYDAAYMATGPSGTQYEVGRGSVSTSIPTPDFPVSVGTPHDVPWGSDSSTADRRILLFVTEDTAYASGIIICQNFVQASPSRTAFPMLLTDVAFAANSANQGSKYCVIAIGSDAVTALSNEKATLHEYTDFSNWEAQGSGSGFIACGTTSGLTNYQNANTYANAAYNNGW